MDKENEYQEYAAECLRLAKAARKTADKALLLTMAERWRKLAALAAYAQYGVPVAPDAALAEPIRIALKPRNEAPGA